MSSPQPLLRRLGKNGPLVNAMALGCMSMSFHFVAGDDDESLRVLHRALDMGINFWDTADAYGHNEELLAKVLATRRSEVFLCTKFGLVDRDPKRPEVLKISGKPEYVRKACEKSLKRLGVDYIDLYYIHRVDVETPIEDTIAAMAELQREGKIRHIGISECSAETLRRAYKVAPIAAVQVEFSPWTLDIETNGLLAACRELGVAIVAYSPLGRGFLTGAYKTIDDFPPEDMRRRLPRFHGDNFAKNLMLVDKFNEMAAAKNITNSQLVLAWVLAQGDDFIVLPGTRRVPFLEENAGALHVKLTEEDEKTIRDIIATVEVAGARTFASNLETINR